MRLAIRQVDEDEFFSDLEFTERTLPRDTAAHDSRSECRCWSHRQFVSVHRHDHDAERSLRNPGSHRKMAGRSFRASSWNSCEAGVHLFYRTSKEL